MILKFINVSITKFISFLSILVGAFKSILFTSIIWLLIIVAISMKHDSENSNKQRMVLTGDVMPIPLIIETNSEYSDDKLSELFSSLPMSSIEDMSENEIGLESYFNCTYIDIAQYTMPMASSFGNNMEYSAIFSELTLYDKFITTKSFIKTNNLGDKYINYVSELTKNGESGNQASAIYLLKTEYNTKEKE
jgi:hypothetical protein